MSQGGRQGNLNPRSHRLILVVQQHDKIVVKANPRVGPMDGDLCADYQSLLHLAPHGKEHLVADVGILLAVDVDALWGNAVGRGCWTVVCHLHL